MSKKYAFWGKDGSGNYSVAELQSKIKQNYISKYYNIWMSKFEWSGLDEDVKEQQENFIMRKFWSDGQVACRYAKNIDTLVFAPFAAYRYNLYDFPEEVTLVNLRNAPHALIPSEPQVVNKDVVIGWCQPNRKSVSAIVNHYVNRMVQVDMVINTNLQLQKMPFLVGVNEADGDKMRDIVRRILNDEIVVYADLEDLARVQTLATQTPYVIDKLSEYKRSLEQELLTFFGIDNNGSGQLEQTHVSVDAVNANNDMINDFGRSIEEEINKWLAQISRVFGRTVSITNMSAPVNTVHEEPQEEPKQEENKDE